MTQKIPLKDCKLWWPAWMQGVPFTGYGFYSKATGPGYEFYVDKHMDSWLCPDGSLMPINSSKLCKEDGTVIPYTSFSIVHRAEGVMVQVNNKLDDGYTIHYYLLKELYFIGETYSDND